MSISNFVPLKEGVIAVTGGAAVPFVSTGNSMDKNHVYFDGTTIGSRKEINFSCSAPKPDRNTPSGYTLARSKIVMYVPYLHPVTGERSVNKYTIHQETDINYPDSERVIDRGLLAQVLTGLPTFWDSQSAL